MKHLYAIVALLACSTSVHAQVSILSIARHTTASASITTVGGQDSQSQSASSPLPGPWSAVLAATAASDSGPHSHGYVSAFAMQHTFIDAFSFSGILSTGVGASGDNFSYTASADSSLDLSFMAHRQLGWIARRTCEGLPTASIATLTNLDTTNSITLSALSFGSVSAGTSYALSAQCDMKFAGGINTLGFNTSASQQISFMLFADECGSAVEIRGLGPFEFDNSVAGRSIPDEPACESRGAASFGRDVWFRWRSDCPGSITISTCGATMVDTKLAVYVDGCPGGPGTLRGCNDDSCGSLQSSIRTYSLNGRDYLIRIGTFDGAPGGQGSFSISCCPCDFNGSGTIESSDVFAYLTAFLAGFSDADFDGNGLVNTLDYFQFMSCFFAPPDSCS